MKTFKQFINEGIKDILIGKSEKEIKQIYNNLPPDEKLKYISEQRGGTSGVENHIYMYPPIKVGKVNNTDAFITFYYYHRNEFYDEFDLVFHLIYNEKKDKQFDDTVFDFTYINSKEIKEHNHQGKFIHHRDKELVLEIDDDYLERIVKLTESSENIKLNDNYYKMKDEMNKLFSKKSMTDEEKMIYAELNFKTETISKGKENVWRKKQIERRKAMTPEERKKEDDRINKIAFDIINNI